MIAFLTDAWTFLKSKWGIRLGITLTTLALLSAVWLNGDHHGSSREKAAEASRLKAAKARVVKREAKAASITEHVAEKLTKDRERIVYRTRTLTKEIPVYVSPQDDAACRIPPGWLRLHDAASRGEAGVP